jgi:cysteinyl-tRNA synthetase
MLYLYNSLTRREELFQPLTPKQVSIYCCGVTVYDYCHLGHARSYIVWDTLRRYLLWLGYKVKYVQNFTDIDDKILNRAKQENVLMEDIAEKYIQAYFEDMERLNIMKADAYPRVTHTLDGIKRLIHELEQKEYTYEVKDDGVYFDISKFEGYGKLSKRNIEVTKENDFVLWKSAKPEEPNWPSKWGPGRPGWHIECSAMIRDTLGDRIDIHCGGADLVFPHHENEIAQSEAVTGHMLSQFWLHNGFVTLNGDKMSKSQGNFTSIRDLLDLQGISPMALRLFVLQAHYRKPLAFTTEALESASNSWKSLNKALIKAKENITEDSQFDLYFVARFNDALDCDLNTAKALAVLFELAKNLTPCNSITLLILADVLGLRAMAIEDEALSSHVLQLISARNLARKAKNWAEADLIHQKLLALGVEVQDR